jgi:ubiquitin C-terminal hydrolase
MPDNFILNHASYILSGVITHYGSIGGGHYVYQHKFDSKWKLFNDDSVDDFNEDEKIKKKGYVYLYERI